MNYGYHLTSLNAAIKMKAGGMQSSLSRLGVVVANPNGAFAKNRAVAEPRKRAERLKRDVAALMFAGASLSDLLAVTLNKVPMAGYQAHGRDPGEDRQRLDAVADEALDCFRDQVPALRGKTLVKTGKPFFAVWRSTSVADAVEALRSKMTHFLTRLSVQYTDGYYRVEEMQTATHVYFSKPDAAIANYVDYKKHLGNENPLVILRVNLGDVDWAEDEGQAGALKIRNHVGPEQLQILKMSDRFMDDGYRSAETSWIPLTAFKATAVRERPRIGYGYPPVNR